MRSSTGLLALASLVFLTTVPVQRLAGGEPHAAEGFWFCTSYAEQNNPIYVTPVWHAKLLMYDVQIAFRQLLVTKYSYQGAVSCSRADMGEQALARQQAAMEQMYAQWEKNGKKLVRTGWTKP
jgi:hypothetical protein